jgi:hypothetical protein
MPEQLTLGWHVPAGEPGLDWKGGRRHCSGRLVCSGQRGGATGRLGLEGRPPPPLTLPFLCLPLPPTSSPPLAPEPLQRRMGGPGEEAEMLPHHHGGHFGQRRERSGRWRAGRLLQEPRADGPLRLLPARSLVGSPQGAGRRDRRHGGLPAAGLHGPRRWGCGCRRCQLVTAALQGCTCPPGCCCCDLCRRLAACQPRAARLAGSCARSTRSAAACHRLLAGTAQHDPFPHHIVPPPACQAPA